MTITTETPFGALLAGPLESQTANPLESTVPPTEDGSYQGRTWLSAIALRDRKTEDERRSAREPRAREMQQYLDDERRGRLEQAHSLVESVPDSTVAWARLAQMLLTAGEFDNAAEAARHTIKLAVPSSTEFGQHHAVLTARFVAARVLAALGWTTDSEDVLAALPGTGPWQVLYAALAEGRGETATALTRLEGGISTEAAAYRGFLLLQLNRPQVALAELRTAQRRGASGPSLLLNLAYGFACVGSPQKAIRAAQQAVVMAPLSRHASFNLASYLRTAGQNMEAVAELRRLQLAIGGGDPQVAAAVANAYSACGMQSDALRELRRAQHHNDFDPRSARLAELRANTALLEWRLGTKSRTNLLKVIRAQIDSVGAHLPLVLMLADVSVRREGYTEVRRLYEDLRTKRQEKELRPLLVRLQLMDGQLDDATETAITYATDNPLDLDAVRGALILQGQIFGEYDQAAKAGLIALRRAPGDLMLRNNVAFCLAWAGRAHEAHEVLRRQKLDDPYLLATRGLVDFGLGRVAAGLAWYDRAEMQAVKILPNADDVADFVGLLRNQESLALQQLVPGHVATWTLAKSVAPPSGWLEDPRYLILERVASRLGRGWDLPRA